MSSTHACFMSQTRQPTRIFRFHDLWYSDDRNTKPTPLHPLHFQRVTIESKTKFVFLMKPAACLLIQFFMFFLFVCLFFISRFFAACYIYGVCAAGLVKK